MTITDPNAIRYSDEFIRTSADRLAQRYYNGLSISDHWIALGGGQTATDALRNDIYSWSDVAYHWHLWFYNTTRRWVAYGQIMIPNTGEDIADGSPADGRPANDTTKSRDVITRVTEALDDWEANSFAKLNTILTVIKQPASSLSSGDAANAITRMIEIVADMEAENNAKLNTVLALAVNPGG